MRNQRSPPGGRGQGDRRRVNAEHIVFFQSVRYPVYQYTVSVIEVSLLSGKKGFHSYLDPHKGPKYWAPHVTDCTGLRNINNYKFKTLKSGRTNFVDALSVVFFGAAESAGGLRFSRKGSETDDLAIFAIHTVALARLAGPIF